MKLLQPWTKRRQRAKGKYQILISKTPFGRDSNIANRLVTIIRRSSLSYYVEADFPNIWGIVQQLFLEFDISFLKQKCNLWNWGIFSWMRTTFRPPFYWYITSWLSGSNLDTDGSRERTAAVRTATGAALWGMVCLYKRDGKPTRSHIEELRI